MDKMYYPKGLIRYITENSLKGVKTQLLRPRVIVYAVMLILLTSAVFWGIAMRDLVSLDVIRDRNALYCEAVEGLIENVYTLKVINKGGVIVFLRFRLIR